MAGCADHPATALVLVVQADAETLSKIDHIEISASRGGEERFLQSYALPAEARLPGTLTLSKDPDADPSDPILVRVVGSKESPEATVSRSARLGFVKEKTKLLRMPLTAACLNKKCDPGLTCIDGACVSDTVDPNTLPDFSDNNSAVAGSAGSSGTSGAGGTSGSAGQGGTAGTGGTAGASGAGGTAGLGGAAGTAGSGGTAGSAGTGGTAGSGGTGGSAGATGTYAPLTQGDASACSIVSGLVRCWGYTAAGSTTRNPSVFAPNYEPVAVPVALVPGEQYVSLSMGSGFVCAVRSSLKDVDCWGQNFTFQIGDPDGAARFATLTFAAPVLSMASTRDVTCVAIDVAGDNVQCWGSNAVGSLGVSSSTLTASATPVTIAGLSGARVVEGGNSNGLFCALSSQGDVSCWGGDAIAQFSPPVVVTSNVVEIAVGTRSEGLLTRDAQGNVSQFYHDAGWQWANLGVLTGLGLAKAIAFGAYACALGTDGVSVTCLQTSGGVPSAPTTQTLASPANLLRSGADVSQSEALYVCARHLSEGVSCWGEDSFGKLGINSPNIVHSPTLITPSSPPTALFAGAFTTASRHADGSITAWGKSTSFFGDHVFHPIAEGAVVLAGGQGTYSLHEAPSQFFSYALGTSSSMLSGGSFVTPARLLSAAGSLTDAVAGEDVDLGIDGVLPKVSAWVQAGYPNSWSIVPTVPLSSDLVDVPMPGNVVPTKLAYRPDLYSNSELHACVLAAGKVYCWGSNDSGQCAQDATAQPVVYPPAEVLVAGNPLAATDLCAGRYHTCAATLAGDVYCWGANDRLQVDPLAADPYGHSETPLLVTSFGSSPSLACGWYFTCAYTSGEVRCWGDNDKGQVGSSALAIAKPAQSVASLTNLPPAGYTAIDSVQAGYDHACALLSGGQNPGVSCWGSNLFGQVGVGSTGTVPTPQPVQGLVP